MNERYSRKHSAKKMKSHWRLMILSLLVFGCDKQSGSSVVFIDYQQINVKVDRGIFVSDDYYITNNSPYEMSNVEVTVTATGSYGETRTLNPLWGEWKVGETKHVVASIHSDQTVGHIKKLSVVGHTSGTQKPKYFFGVDYDFKD